MATQDPADIQAQPLAPDNTSAMALHSLTLARLSAQAAAVLQAVRNLQAGGARNCSLREIQAALETAHGGARWECGTIAARVNALVAAGRLVRLPDSRKCSITGATVRPVVAVAEQRLLVA